METWGLAIRPDNLGFKEAAALPIGAMTAMYLLDKASLNKGQKVLVYGASGSVGSYAVQLAKQQDAMVTGVCSGPNFDMVRFLGADNVLDYKKEDYSESLEKFDIVFDAVGKTTKSKAKKVLKEGGAFVTIKMLTKEKNENLVRIKQLAEAGKLKPFIDRTFGLNEIVAAHEYVDLGRKRGNVVIEIVQ